MEKLFMRTWPHVHLDTGCFINKVILMEKKKQNTHNMLLKTEKMGLKILDTLDANSSKEVENSLGFIGY